MIPDVALDPLAERHRGGRAADACAVQADPDKSVRRDIDQFDIAAVGLNRWTHEVENLGHTTEDVGEGFSIGVLGAGV